MNIMNSQLASMAKKMQEREVDAKKEKKTFKCEKCDIEFHVEYQFRNHTLKKHKSVRCDTCDINYPNKTHFDGHLKKMHSQK